MAIQRSVCQFTVLRFLAVPVLEKNFWGAEQGLALAANVNAAYWNLIPDIKNIKGLLSCYFVYFQISRAFLEEFLLGDKQGIWDCSPNSTPPHRTSTGFLATNYGVYIKFFKLLISSCNVMFESVTSIVDCL